MHLLKLEVCEVWKEDRRHVEVTQIFDFEEFTQMFWKENPPRYSNCLITSSTAKTADDRALLNLVVVEILGGRYRPNGDLNMR